VQAAPHQPARHTLPAALCLLLLALGLPPGQASAVPAVDHIGIDCAALRLVVNDYSLRYQIKVIVTLAAQENSGLNGIETTRVIIGNPEGLSVTLKPHKLNVSPKKFKAANATIVFKAAADSDAPKEDTVPPGFFSSRGPYSVAVVLHDEQYSGTVSFGPEVSLRCEQAGQAAQNFALSPELPLDIYTDPSEFGPVYYKRQDVTNFFYQLANMDNALMGGDFHAPIESPKYIFQIRSGPKEGGPTEVLDPQLYIEGAQEHLIRSELTKTPLRLSPGSFQAGQVLLVDFMRQETGEPDSQFIDGRENMGSSVVVQDRVVYALQVQDGQSAADSGLTPEQRARRTASKVTSQIGED
jgi:hypothetical protein